MGHTRTTKVVIVCTAVLFFLSFYYFLSRGVPLNDFRLWRLEKNFKTLAPLYHPPESILLQKKKYLGGPYTHGSLTCSFFVGELRAAPLRKEEIRHAYNIPQTSLKVLFFDESRWTMNSPLGDWWDEWYQNPLIATSSTVYFLFSSEVEYPFLGDYRCDD